MAKTIVASWSEIQAARQCPMKHELGYVQRWRRPGLTSGSALARGILWHEVTEIHYNYLQECQRAGTEPQTPFLKKLIADKLNLEHGPTDDEQLILWMYQGHLAHYGFDPDWTILAVEHHAEFWLPTERGGRSRFKLKMKIDMVVEDEQGRLWVVDRKTGKDLPKGKMLEMDDQFGLYTWGLRALGKRVYGQIYDSIRTQRNKDDTPKGQPLASRFQRVLMYRNEAELDKIAVEAYQTLRTRYSTPPVRHPSSRAVEGCNWCEFTHPCLNSRKEGDAFLPEMLEGEGMRVDLTRH